MTRSATLQTIAVTAALGLAPAGYACESGKMVVAAYPDAQTARLSYEGAAAEFP